MKKFLNVFLLVALAFLSLNVAVEKGFAAGNPPSAELIKDASLFYYEFDFSEKDLQENNTYGKYYKIVFPKNGILYLFLEGPKVSIYDEKMNLIKKIKPELDYVYNGYKYYLTEFEGNLKAGTYYIYLESNQPIKNVKFFGIFSLPAVKSNDIIVKNNIGNNNDTITINNLEIGSYYYISVDGSEYIEFKANKKEKTVSVKKLKPKGGIISVFYCDKNDFCSEEIEKKYSAEPTKPIAASNVTVTNNKNKADVISFKNLTKGATYKIYADSSKKKLLKKFTASGKTEKVSIKQLSAKAGSIYITVTEKGLKESAVTKVSYKGEPTPALSAKNVKITNKKKGKDTITLSGLKKETTYVIYKDAKKKTKLATIKATKSTHSVKVNLDTKGGKVYITAQAPGYGVSSTTTVSYKKAK